MSRNLASVRRIVSFFAFACGLSWLFWAPLVAWSWGWTDTRPSVYLHLAGGLGPALAAVIFSARDGRAALARLGRRAFRAPAHDVILAIVAPIALFLVAALTLRILGFDIDLAATGRSPEYPDLPLAAYVAASLLCYGFGEELGWRGYALTRLQARTSSVRATSWLALGWAVWHLPLFVFADGMKAMGPAEIAGWAASIYAGAFLLTWVFERSGRSVLVVALFHGTLDVLINSPTGGPLQSAMGALVTVAGFTILAVRAWDARPRGQTQALRVEAG